MTAGHLIHYAHSASGAFVRDAARSLDPDDVLAQGFRANLSALPLLQLLCGLTDQQAAAVCCVSPRTYRRWRKSGQPHPVAVRFLAVLAGYVPWDGWQGWEVHKGLLFPPGFSRHGISPGYIQAITFREQLVSEYRRQNEQLRTEIEELRRRQGSGLRSWFGNRGRLR